MAGDDEVVRLIMEVEDSKLQQARKTIQSTTTETYEFAQSIQHLSGETYEFADDAKFVDQVLKNVEQSAERASTALNSTAASIKAAGAAARDASGSTGNFTMMVQQASYGLADFAQTSGSLGSKLMSATNNIQFMTAGLGPWGVAIGLGSVAVAALVQNWSSISSLWEERNPIPRVTDGIEGMTDAIKHNDKELKELEKQQSLSNAQLARYNELTAENAELEAKKTAEKEKQHRIDQALRQQSDEEKERTKDFNEGLDGRGKEVLSGIEETLAKKAQHRIDFERRQMEQRIQANVMSGASASEQDAFAAEQKKQFEAFAKQLKGDWSHVARDLFDRALQGEEAAIKSIQGLTQGFGSVEMFSFGERLKKAQEASQKKKADRTDKELEKELNKEGKEGENQALNELAQMHGLKHAPRTVDEFNRMIEHQKGVAETAKKRDDAAKTRTAEAQKKLEDKDTHTRIKRQNDEENAAIKSSGIDQLTEGMLAQVGAEGGAEINGRFRKMNSDQQFDFVKGQVGRWLHRKIGEDQFGRDIHANRNMNAAQTEDLAMRITAMAMTQLGLDMNAQSGQGLNQNQAAAVVGGKLAAHRPRQGKPQKGEGFKSVGLDEGSAPTPQPDPQVTRRAASLEASGLPAQEAIYAATLEAQQHAGAMGQMQGAQANMLRQMQMNNQQLRNQVAQNQQAMQSDGFASYAPYGW